MTVDLATQTVTSSDGTVYGFDIDPHRKHCLINGLDDIGLTLEKAASINAYEAKLGTLRPWA
jgi:3-isopropylmalate/(R)-2-methylmalate dehydratase small subunit